MMAKTRIVNIWAVTVRTIFKSLFARAGGVEVAWNVPSHDNKKVNGVKAPPRDHFKPADLTRRCFYNSE